MQNFSKQTKRALEFVERLSEGGYGEKTEICCSDECSGRLTCNIGQAFLHEGHLRIVIDIRYPVTKKQKIFFRSCKQKLLNQEFASLVLKTADHII